MTDIKEVALPELPQALSDAMMEFGVAYRNGTALDRVFHLKKLQDFIKAYAKAYGALCYEAGQSKIRAAFHVNMLRCYPEKSHSEIEYAINESLGVSITRAQPSAQDAAVQEECIIVKGVAVQGMLELAAHYVDAGNKSSILADQIRRTMPAILAALKQSLAQSTVKQSLMVAEPKEIK